MTYKEVIKHFGSLTKTAQALERPLTTVSFWRNGVPFGVQCEIQIVTGGKLRANFKDRG